MDVSLELSSDGEKAEDQTYYVFELLYFTRKITAAELLVHLKFSHGRQGVRTSDVVFIIDVVASAPTPSSIFHLRKENSKILANQ